jgi:hypothetical protein
MSEVIEQLHIEIARLKHALEETRVFEKLALGRVTELEAELAQVRRQNSDLQSANEGYLDRAIKAERVAGIKGMGMSMALVDVLTERITMTGMKGWTPDHDDMYTEAQLTCGAICYAAVAMGHQVGNKRGLAAFIYHRVWPWSDENWKSSSQRSSLILGACLLIAEIERLDRSSSERSIPTFAAAVAAVNPVNVDGA